MPVNRRGQIAMSSAEIADFFEQQRVVVVATNDPSGWPHLMPLWYVVRDGEIWAWTYAKSQKVRNLERDRRTTLQIEAGEEYQELRGVMVHAQAVIHREVDAVAEIGTAIFRRYTAESMGESLLEAVRAQAAKLVALQFVAQRVVSWDHGKLGGAY
jgi:nitroimidazol reductase NimA-like FMN-containing flavoprotein (pyridoxamine 5'-phosphate oxidase superfamily)